MQSTSSTKSTSGGNSPVRTLGLIVILIGLGMFFLMSASTAFSSFNQSMASTLSTSLDDVSTTATIAQPQNDKEGQEHKPVKHQQQEEQQPEVPRSTAARRVAQRLEPSSNLPEMASFKRIEYNPSSQIDDSELDLDLLLGNLPVNSTPMKIYAERSQRVFERSQKSSWDPKVPMAQKDVFKFFENTLAIMMISPPRYHIVQEVQKHYEPFFNHIVFCGPQNNSDYGVQIHGYDVVFGNLQYLAVKNILKHFMSNDTMRKAHEPPAGYEADETLLKPHHITGMIYIADDLFLQPWAIAAKNYNKNIPWAVQMGIGHIRSWEKVAAVPMMAVESKFRKSGWPYWRRNHGKMNRILEEGGEHFRARLALAAKSTHPQIYRWSKYNRMNYTLEEAHPWSIFYTIIDTYYVPRAMWQGYVIGAELMAKHWVFGECAIATVLRALHPTYEELAAQFYWSGGTANDCVRFRWSIGVDSFHRCRHDHVFGELIYRDDETRNALAANASFATEAMKMRGLYPVPFAPMPMRKKK